MILLPANPKHMYACVFVSLLLTYVGKGLQSISHIQGPLNVCANPALYIPSITSQVREMHDATNMYLKQAGHVHVQLSKALDHLLHSIDKEKTV